MIFIEYSFHIQDPTSESTQYLYEAIVSEVERETLIKWRGIFSFASRAAVRNLFIEEPAITTFLGTGEIEMVVGIDAVTNAAALSELSDLTTFHENFNARVFFNPGTGLFHPKICHFQHEDNHSVLIVGSGNLTDGGLRRNIEAYSIIRGTNEEILTISQWDEFLERHRENIRGIDQEALDRAALNIVRSRRRRVVEEEEELITDDCTQLVVDDELEDEGINDRVLVAQVPSGGARWQQIHYNKEVVRVFFRITRGTSERLFLQEVMHDRTLGPAEVRPIIYSESNKNYKVETASHHGVSYPTDNPPIIVLRELGLRSFRYILLMPGESGYEEMHRLSVQMPKIGKGHPRVIATLEQVRTAWSDCPL